MLLNYEKTHASKYSKIDLNYMYFQRSSPERLEEGEKKIG